MISAIFSVDQVGGIGHNGTLPWPHHSEDMAWFRELTTNQVVLMGRKTWDDPKMPKPLPNRTNYVLTSSSLKQPLAVTLGGDPLAQLQSLAAKHPDKNIFVIGGANLIETCKPLLDFVYVTYRRGNHRCDTRINMYDFLVGMRAISSRPSKDKMLNFTIYRNIHSEVPLHEGLY